MAEPAGISDRLIGRADERERLRRLVLEDGTRLTTLWGPPGIGKTRLALELIRSADSSLPAFFCPLASCRTERQVLKVVSQGVDFTATVARGGVDAVSRIGRALAGRGTALLVLDNADHVLEPVARALAVWNALAPEVRCVLTSRELSHAPGEMGVELAPLGCSLNGDAVGLLLDRARAVRPGFEADPDILRAIVERLDGIPLAIELAAARLAIVEPQQLLERLAKRFEVLRVAHPGRPARQRALESSIDASWELLDPRERDVLVRLSVFRGGFDMDAAVAVVPLEPGEVHDSVLALREKSLLAPMSEPDASARFTLLESISEYAGARLGAARGDAEHRHASHFAGEGLSHAARVDRRDAEQALWWLAREEDNLLAVVERAERSDSAVHSEFALAAATALEPLYSALGPADLAVDLAERALALARDQALEGASVLRLETSRSHACFVAGQLADALHSLQAASAAGADADPLEQMRRGILSAQVLQVLGNHAEARVELEAVLARAESLSDLAMTSHALAGLGHLHHVDGDVSLAVSVYQRALRLLSVHGSPRIEVRTRARLAFAMLDLGDSAAALTELDAALVGARSLRSPALEGAVIGYLGNAQRARRHFDRAEAHYLEAIRVLKTAGDRRFEATFGMDRGVLRLSAGRYESARELLMQSAVAASEIGDPRLSSLIRAYLALADLLEGETERARTGLDELEADVRDVALGRVVAMLDEGIAVFEGSAKEEVDLDALRHKVKLLLAGAGTDHERILATLLAEKLNRDFPPADAVLIREDCSAIRAPKGNWVELAAHPSQMRLLVALSKQRGSEPGIPVSAEALVAAGWPGERLARASALNRLRVAIVALRRAGLGESLCHVDPGYLLESQRPPDLGRIGALRARLIRPRPGLIGSLPRPPVDRRAWRNGFHSPSRSRRLFSPPRAPHRPPVRTS